ncbi:MAG TPA: hypothetical protein VFZ24_16760 [Longimicrobiales bacterium]
MADLERGPLLDILAGIFTRPFDEPLNDAEFNAIALRLFARQYERNAPYAAFCARRGRAPEAVSHWTRIPPVPTAAFREVALVAGNPDDAHAVFRTSGTTRGPERRGVHYIPDLSVYHASLIRNFAACMLPDGARLRMVSIVPASREMPDSSLAHMIDVVLSRLGAGQGTHCATVDGGIDAQALSATLHEAERSGVPVCLLGTSFSFVHWLDGLVERGERFRLPDGSRLMDTGGYKGRSREVEEPVLREMYRELLGIPATHCVNEYGMTEMCSQFYDSTLRDTLRGRDAARRKLVPPWVRTRVVHPETLEPLSSGETGILQHFDLANAGSVMAIQTEDLGVQVEGGFRLIGRARGVTPRGCSIAMDILLDAVRERSD